MIYRKVKSLDNVISVSLAAPARTDQGWVFSSNANGTTASSDESNNTRELVNDAPVDSRFADPLLNLSALHQLYTKENPDYTGRVTVPVLWDKKTGSIASNESAEIIRMFNTAFNSITDDRQNFYPVALADEIDELNDFIFHNINNGVYKAGFARTQQAYDSAVKALFDALDAIEERLMHSRYLVGDNITEADWRLLPTLVRFDVAYVSAFKCNLHTISDYPKLSALLNDLYQKPGVAETVDLDIYRAGYHSQSDLRNPHGIVPVGPKIAFVI